MTERGGNPLLRMTERGKSAPQNDSIPPPFVILSLPPIVILSEAKNLPSHLKSTVPKILRSEAPQNDREGGNPLLRMTERGKFAPQSDSIPLLSFRASPHCHSERSEESSLPPFCAPPCHSEPSPPVIPSPAGAFGKRTPSGIRRRELFCPYHFVQASFFSLTIL